MNPHKPLDFGTPEERKAFLDKACDCDDGSCSVGGLYVTILGQMTADVQTWIGKTVGEVESAWLGQDAENFMVPYITGEDIILTAEMNPRRLVAEFSPQGKLISVKVG